MRRPILPILSASALIAVWPMASAQVPPIQPPPGMAADASNAFGAAARGNLAAGGALQLHQNAGGDIGAWGPTSTVPSTLLRSNANMPLSADMIYWISRDASLQVYLTCATPIAGSSVGVDWVVSGTTYSPRYTVQGGDTANACALGIGNAINNHAALKAALAAYHIADSGAYKGDGIGYAPYQAAVANQTGAGTTIFDQPYGTTLTAVSAGGTTVSIAGSAIAGATPALDGGPGLIVERQVPGYTPRTGDLVGQLIFQGPLTSANNSTVLAKVGSHMISPSAAALDLANGGGDQFSLMNGYGYLKNGSLSSYYLAVAGSGGSALFGVWGATSFVQHGAGQEFQVQTNGGGLGTIDAATYKLNGAQIACGNLSNAAASCSTDATNASNITAGILGSARGGAGTTNGVLQGNGAGTVSQGSTTGLSDTTAPTSYAPVLTFGGGNTGITYGGANSGVYTKVGKHVTYQFNLVLTAKGSSTGTASILLPVAVNTTGTYGAGGCAQWTNFTAAYGVTLIPGGTDANHADLKYVNGSGAISGGSDAAFTNTTGLICSISYVAS